MAMFQTKRANTARSQRLILPMTDSRQVAGYKNKYYSKAWGFAHYGWDFNSKEREPWVMAQGDGVVAAAGLDRVFGNCVVVVYKQCELHDGTICDITVRYYHMQPNLRVRKGQAVKAGDKLGLMGNTGLYTSGPHLHITMDTDIKYPCYEPGLARSGQIIKKGLDSTIDPQKVIWRGAGQRIVNGAYKGWNSPEDYNLPAA